MLNKRIGQSLVGPWNWLRVQLFRLWTASDLGRETDSPLESGGFELTVPRHARSTEQLESAGSLMRTR